MLLSHEFCTDARPASDDTTASPTDPTLTLNAAGTWAISPLLARAECVERLLGERIRWLVVCEALSRVNVSALAAALHAEAAHRVSCRQKKPETILGTLYC